MRYLNQTALLTCILLLAACSAGSTTDPGSLQSGSPQQGLGGSVRHGAFAVVAVDADENIIPGLNESLGLEVRRRQGITTVSVSFSDLAARAQVFLHMSYDSERLHPLAVRAGECPGAEAIFLGVISEPDAVALGMVTAGLRPELGGDFVVAEVDFADGATSSSKSVRSLMHAGAEVGSLKLGGENLDQLQWYYSLAGDLDMNGEVNISDLSPIGAHLHAAVPLDGGSPDRDAAAYPADANSDGLVTINDIMPIGANYRSSLRRYVVKSRPEDSVAFSDTGQQVSVSEGGGSGMRWFSQPIENPADQTYYAVVPANDNSEGPLSNAVYFDSSAGINPPANLQFGEIDGMMQLSWQPPINGQDPDAYMLYYSESIEAFEEGTAVLHPDSPLTGTFFSFEPVSLEGEADLYFALRSMHGGEEGTEFSNKALWLRQGGQPCLPAAGLTASRDGDNILLEWEHPGNGQAPNYSVGWCTGDPDDLTTLVMPLGTTSEASFVVSDPGIPAGESHWFVLINHCSGGQLAKASVFYTP